MSKGFLESFVEKPVRESAGSLASNRFDYQKNWSLCQLLELHSNFTDYLMVFEYHDDVVVFDSEDSPQKADFYQVKTKSSGSWTINSLIKSDGEKNSIFHKMYGNHTIFADNAKSLIFTSNQPLSAILKNKTKSLDLAQVCFSELSIVDKEKIQLALEPNNQEYCDLNGLNKLTIQKNKLTISDHTQSTKGKLVEFFEKIHPESEVHISLVYKTFFDEIRKKTNYEGVIEDVSDLRHKSISRTYFQKMIGSVIKRKTDNDLWKEAHNTLTFEGLSILKIKEIGDSWTKYIVSKMNVTDELNLKLSEDIKELIPKVGEDDSFKDLSIKIISNLSKDYSNEYGETYIKAAILYEVLRYDPISKIDKKLTEETK
ncbi:MAG: dsDNA nuclease domain-containing protein [Methylophilus sp.]